ncbi:hypothetical protein GCM10010191_22250 [Actinomadura vinacea]|uniref:Uncharacterized protein n=1 Tax=Actinomadura vinacea TaxID=115336 RepID=A0ABN3IRU6_9ACTN
MSHHVHGTGHRSPPVAVAARALPGTDRLVIRKDAASRFTGALRANEIDLARPPALAKALGP